MAVRTATWWLYAFLSGLHIIGWSNHEIFNIWWLLAFALGGVTLDLAGTVFLTHALAAEMEATLRFCPSEPLFL